MKRTSFAVLLCGALAVVADDTPSLVETARAAKEKKKKSTTRVITNADVKKSKGVVVENKPSGTVDPAPQKTLLEQSETSYRERQAREEKLSAVTKRVTDLERELRAIEQSYYDENDLDKRDTDIVKRFNEVKAKLDAAKKEMDTLAPEDGRESSVVVQPPTS